MKEGKKGFIGKDIDRREFLQAGAGIVLPGIALIGINITSSCSQAGAGGGSGGGTLQPDQLGIGTWKTGSIAAGGSVWWYFSCTSGTQYSIYWDDYYSGSGTYTADIKVSAYRSNQSTSYFTDVDSGYHSPSVITAAESNLVYIRILGYYSSSAGTFAVKVDQGGAVSCSGCTGGATSVSCSGCTGGATSVSCSDCTAGATTGCSDCTTGCSASCRDSCHRSCSGTCSGSCSGWSP